MSELNRPETPGPWEFGPHDRSRYLTSWGVFGGAVSGPLTPDDFAAIADLPAWIEAHDMWKARAEKAEAALVLAEACLAEIRGIDVHDEIATILDKYGYWDDGE